MLVLTADVAVLTKTADLLFIAVKHRHQGSHIMASIVTAAASTLAHSSASTSHYSTLVLGTTSTAPRH